MKSVFGCVLSGRLYETIPNKLYSSPQLLCIFSVSQSDISKFGDLETVGIKPKELVESHNEIQILREFESKLHSVNGHSTLEG